MRLSFDIYYIITVPDWRPEEATLLQGFAPSLCRNSWLIRAVCAFPSNVLDLTPKGAELFVARRMGGTNPVNWFPQSPRAITSIPIPEFTPFTVVLIGEGDDASSYDQWAKSCAIPPITVAKSGGSLTYEEFTLEQLQRRLLAVCDLIPTSLGADDIERARAAISEWAPPPTKPLGYQVGGHGSVYPNLMALTAAGYSDMVYGRFDKLDAGSQPYVDQIARTAHSIFDERDRIGPRSADKSFRRPPDLNLFAPAIFPYVFEIAPPPTAEIGERRQFQAAVTALQRQPGYMFEARTNSQKQALLGLTGDAQPSKDFTPKPHFLFLERQREVALGTNCVGALAASEVSAVLRLPNDVNRSIGSVRQFAEHYRGGNASARKRLLAFRRVQSRLAEAIPAEFYDLIERSREGIRIISDAHLEWLDLDGLPLGLRKNVSRVPVTPGNLFVGELTARAPIRLSQEDFQEVLIVSALEDGDPIRTFFENAFKEFSKEWRDTLNLRFVEVSNEDELVAALNGFSGALVLFDGHGSHNPDEPGYLHLKKERVDVWRLRGRVRPPPIVVLSACDTHAADRNHATTASGFLSLGTSAVLGSVFPLGAFDASLFAARLLYRVSTYVPIALKAFDRALKWTELVSGMLRMQLMTDHLRILLAQGLISETDYRNIHLEANVAINDGREEPFADILEFLVSAGVERPAAIRSRELAVATSSAISYLHMGRPERILLDSKERFSRHMQDISKTAPAPVSDANCHSDNPIAGRSFE